MHKGFTIWFTGLSGSGKSTVSEALIPLLKERGITRIEVLDGDVVRTHLSKGLGFSKEDRDTNIRRIGWVCEVLTRNAVVTIAAAISPYRAIRDEVRGKVGSFVEVFVDCPLEVCAQRDVKGLYAKAFRGEIKEFTGVSDPYEAPLNAEVVLETHLQSPQESALAIVRRLEELGYLAAQAYSKEEEKIIEDRLADLGYF